MKKPDPVTLLSPAGGEATDSQSGSSVGQAIAVGSMFGGYRILRAVGGGGMGQVYEAFDADLARSVAVKVMRPDRAADPDARERFLREARALAAVTNPHVVTIHHVGQHDNQPFLVMEMVAGETLDSRLRNGPLPMLQLLNTAREMAAGLAAAHRAGVVHRDIKPDNVVLAAGEDRAKLIDFGLAHTTRLGDTENASVGTPLYMAPEQVRGTTVTPRTDLFSFGVVLYRMATGKTPFEGQSMTEWRDRLLSDDPPVPPDELNPAVPPPLSGLIHRLLARDPDDRPESARAVEWELSSLLQGLVTKSGTLQLAPRTEATPVPLPLMTPPPANTSAVGTESLPPRRRLSWWVFVAVACPVVVLFGVVLALALAPRQEPGSVATVPITASPKGVVRGEPIELINGRDLSGWHGVEGKRDQWTVKSGVIVGAHKPRTNDEKHGDQFLLTDREFTDYELTFEFRWTAPGGHTTLLLRAHDDWPNAEEDWKKDKYRVTGLQLNLRDDDVDGPPGARKVVNWLYVSGGIYQLSGPKVEAPNKPLGEWNAVKVVLDRSQLRVEWNGVVTFDEDLDRFNHRHKDVPALSRTRGAIALRTHSDRTIEFRKLVLTPIMR